MLQSFHPSSAADRDSALVLIRRLVIEFGLGQWRRYALAFLLMGVAAACTAIPAVSPSRISPTISTSGSCRRMLRSAEPNVIPAFA